MSLSINKDCVYQRFVEASLPKLEGSPLPADFDLDGYSYNQIISFVRHEHTNYDALMSGWPLECPTCPWSADRESRSCFSQTEAYDALKSAARDIAVSLYDVWQQDHQQSE